MLGSIYNGMIGMMAYSNGLSNISNNVANMNTPGYKRTELQFRELISGQQLTAGSYTSGTTVGVDSSLLSTIYAQGDISDSENDTDMGIDGTGFFILRDGNKTFYTRVGQFEFDPEGFLVDKTFGYRVAGFKNGRLVDISIKDIRSVDPEQTQNISLFGDLSLGSSTHTINDVEIYDAEGAKHTLSLEFTNNGAVTARSWTLEITDDEDNVLATGLEVRFNDNGSPAEGFNSASFDLTSEDGTTSPIRISMGEPGSFNQVTNESSGTTSSTEVEKIDGYGPGVMTGFSINESGAIEVEYSNEETLEAVSIALARFESQSQLINEGSGLLSAQSFQTAIVGTSLTLGLGKIEGKSVELSNVDLTSQFTDMIVLQRGYQASSQVLTSANEMLQQLMDATKSR